MMRLVVDERVARYVGERVEGVIYPPYTQMGVEEDGEIVAGVIFNSHTTFDVEVTVAGEARAFTRHFIRQVGRYVFKDLGRLRMSITTSQPHVIDLGRRLSADVEGLKKNHFGPGKDAAILGILKEKWRY